MSSTVAFTRIERECTLDTTQELVAKKTLVEYGVTGCCECALVCLHLQRIDAYCAAYMWRLQIADHDIQFLDQTLSSVILSPSPDPRNLTLELSPYAVARVVITPHTQSHFERS